MPTLYINTQGTTVGFTQNRITIYDNKEEIKSLPIENIDNIVIFGGIQVSTFCMQQLLIRGIPLTYLSQDGKYYGRLESTQHINIMRQKIQFKMSENEKYSIEIAKKFIQGKTHNQRTILLRANRIKKNEKLDRIIKTMNDEIKKIDFVNEKLELTGVEGYIAKIYFSGLNEIIPDEFKFGKRTKQPPLDPFNSILSYGYTLLMYEIYTSIKLKGLNPYIAFLHEEKNNHPALCSDIMEEFRPILVDSLAVYMVNSNQIKLDNFTKNTQNDGIYLDKLGCKKFTEQFEKRLNEEVSYIEELPYKMSIRETINYQVNLLVKSIENSESLLYKPIYIR